MLPKRLCKGVEGCRLRRNGTGAADQQVADALMLSMCSLDWSHLVLNCLPAEAGLQKEQGAEQAQDLAHSLPMRSPQFLRYQSLRYRSFLTSTSNMTLGSGSTTENTIAMKQLSRQVCPCP